MRIAAFLTTEAGPALELLGGLQRRHPLATLSVFVRDEHRECLAPALGHCDVRRDKPAGSRLAFLRQLRRERFDLLVVAWHGGEVLQPLRIAALFCAARRVLAVDERGRERLVAWYAPWTWAGHVLWRLSRLRASAVLRGLAAVHRATIGLAIAIALLVPTMLRLRSGRRPGRRT